LNFQMMRSFIMLVMFFVITVVPTYCQCYFVSYFRSPHHRAVYRKQLKFLFPCLFWGKEEQVVNSRQSAAKVRSISI
uniref:G_PROTEIN_RECEP_F1_2 domain-containing protein n=1 Tax=Haemonchus placei TaxID=6290 RepID=A0A0N4VY09_HAEPC